MRKFPQVYTDVFIIGQVAFAQSVGLRPTAYTLAKCLECTPATAQRNIRRLVDEFYLTYERDEGHPRNALVVNVTEEGLRFLHRHKTKYAGYQVFLFKVLAAREGYRDFYED